jgi:hypothetical protein
MTTNMNARRAGRLALALGFVLLGGLCRDEGAG